MKTKQQLLMGIDVGTTNWKVAVFDTQGHAVCIKKTPTVTHYEDNGQSTYKPDEIWSSIAGLIKEAVKEVEGDIAGVSVTSMAEAVVPVDENGRECFDIITWFDTRSYKEAQEIVDAMGKDRLYQITGLDPNPIFSLCKMLWMKKNHPKVYETSRKWLQMTDYIIFKLTGRMATDYTLASRTLAFDVAGNQWSKEILDKMDVSMELLPDIIESGKVVGKVSEEAGALTDLHTSVPVVMGGNDHPCAALPAGVLNGRKVLDSSGTAESVIYISDREDEPKMEFEGQRTCRFLEASRYALWGGIVSSGASFEWAYNTILSLKEWGIGQSEYTYEEVLDQLKDRKPGAGGVLFIPHLRGSGAPYWNPKMKGAFLGIRSTTTQKDLLQAVMEGLSFQNRMIVEMHQKLSDGEVEALCVVGGSGKNGVWQQTKADVLQLPVEICGETDATALGAAMLAGIGAGIYEDMVDATDKVDLTNVVIHPRQENKAVYDGLYEIFKEAYDATVSISGKLNDFQL